MTVERAEYRRVDGYPFLALGLDGGEALLDCEPKPTLLEAGLVFLGPGWEGLVPAVDFSAPGVTPTRLLGFTSDPAIVGLYRKFLSDLADGTFAPGPVAIPAA